MISTANAAGTSSPFGAQLTAAAASRRLLRAVGAPNALAAAVATEAGFDALWVSGLEVSTALGLPDENVLTSRDLADSVAALGRVSPLPVVVDIDNAGGSKAAARRFAADLARAGAAAVCLEDSTYPKINSFAEHRHQSLTDTATTVEQIRHLRAAADGRLTVIARTEALICGLPLEAAIDRAHAYVKAGAEAVLIHSKDTSGTEALDLSRTWTGPVPLVTVPTAFPHLLPDKLAETGYTLAIYANQLSRASLAAMRAAADSFRTNGSFTVPGIPAASVADLLRIADPDASACL